MPVIHLSPFSAVFPSHSSSRRIFDYYPITASKIHDNRISDIHWHDYLQIWYTVSGEYYQIINGKRILQKAGSCALIFPYTVHRIDSSESNLDELDVIEISIKKGEFEKQCIPFLSHSYSIASFDSFSLSPSIIIQKEQKAAADKICHDLLSEYQKLGAMFTTKMFALVSRLLEICIDSSGSSFSKREISAAKVRGECVSEAIDFLVRNRSESITIDDVSSAVLMSRRAFTDAFSSTIGKTCHEYYTTLKLGAALSYLRYSNMPVSEIAEKCGFANASHLYRVCMAHFGMSPLEVRHACGKWAREYGDALYRRILTNSRIPFITEEDLALHEISLTL